MKTIYKIIFILLAIFAAFKMFAGGGVSKEAHNQKKSSSPADLAQEAALDQQAAALDYSLTQLITVSDQLTQEDINTMREGYDTICSKQLYKSKKLHLNAHLSAAIVFNHPGVIELLGTFKTDGGKLLLSAQNLRDALKQIDMLKEQADRDLEKRGHSTYHERMSEARKDRSGCAKAVLAIVERERIFEKERADIAAQVQATNAALPKPICALIAGYAF